MILTKLALINCWEGFKDGSKYKARRPPFGNKNIEFKSESGGCK